jgi:hypothetical protein
MTDTTITIQPSKTGSAALWVSISGLVIYIISWLIPVYGQELKGYKAYEVTAKLIFEMRLDRPPGLWDKIVMIIASLSPHTNYFIFIIMIILIATGPKLQKPRIYRNILVVSLLINLVWYYGFTENLSDLRIGYYLWILSVILAIIAANMYISKNKKPDEMTKP